MSFEEVEKALKANKVISNKDIKAILEVAKKAKEQNPNWRAGEFQTNAKGATEWVDFKNDLDDIQYKVAMGHILSKDDIWFCLVWARKYISDYANEPVTPVIYPPMGGLVPNTTVSNTASSSIVITYSYHTCSVCTKDIDGVIDHTACISQLSSLVP